MDGIKVVWRHAGGVRVILVVTKLAEVKTSD